MATQNRWVDLFRQIVGRDPKPEEFQAGKASGFDPKSIKPIAGIPFDDAKTEANGEEPLEEAVYDLTEEAAYLAEQAPARGSETVPASSSEADLATTPEEIWVEKFLTFVGRYPTEAEMAQGQQADYALESITPFLAGTGEAASAKSAATYQNQVPVGGQVLPPLKPKMNKWKKRGLIALVICLVAGFAGFFYGSFYFSREQVATRYLKAVKGTVEDSLSYEVWSDTKKTISSKELTYQSKKTMARVTNKKQLLSGDKMQVVGREFLIFPKWAVLVDPVDITVTTNTKDLTVSANDQEVFKTSGTNDKKELKHLYPGSYAFSAVGTVSGQSISLSQDVVITRSQTVKMNVQYVSFSVSSNISDGDLYVGAKKVGSLVDGEAEVKNLAVAGDALVYVKKTFQDKSSIQSDNQVAVSSITDGESLTLDTSKEILDRDTADDLVTVAYSKLESYADYEETPNGLTDVFKNGNQNKFYTDVKATIDSNTTGAKNRSADYIDFSDVDVTKVTQVGKDSYQVDFTVVYTFGYSYSSQHRSYGTIKQKLSWSCTVSLKENRDKKKQSDSNYYYSNSYTYTDYYITGTNGDSSVISTENTVS
ncbi:zinc ribbon domain-containing protein [Streptococcus sp. DD12]|uniref:zinc ribbon domain-containing protein n=1 Tax=Streptococcus sp. DD12 TaxID=1777880 RepID=UPI000795F310|nr:hypothetical protein [Streptococcus sp. DD12]KXT75956.1 hypothetical protein STRDD12_01068 [Streptococcus sp. DD12]